ncbi:MAG TPA: hypothetical protein VNY35_02380 [Solirubrobacteraceae bacterium]|nr:hypothetical protein [Solirubrobacteraceae bacterium]
MRRASTCLALLAFAVLALPSLATAAPTVTLKAIAVPIPKPGGGTYPGTGNIYGAGAAVEAEYHISGTEYGGFPPPVIGVNFDLPTGAKLHPAGFPGCAATILEKTGPTGCPPKSKAGPVGEVLGIVSFGSTRVEEKAELSSFYAPGGGLEFYTFGHSPTLLEILSTGHYINTGGGGGFGPKLITNVPLVATVPGAPFASVLFIKVKVGSALKQGNKLVPYGTLPKKGQCPKGGFKVKSEVIFAENGDPSKPVNVPVSYRPPCPRK